MVTKMMIKGLCLYLDLGQTFPAKAPEKKGRFKSLFTSEECSLCNNEGFFSSRPLNIEPK